LSWQDHPLPTPIFVNNFSAGQNPVSEDCIKFTATNPQRMSHRWSANIESNIPVNESVPANSRMIRSSVIFVINNPVF